MNGAARPRGPWPATLDLADMQGLLRHGYGSFESAAYLLLCIDDVQGAKDWLAALRAMPDPGLLHHASTNRGDIEAAGHSIAIAFSAAGLRRLGVDDHSMRRFVVEFQEGMDAEHRARLLGDVGESHPSSWRWGQGNAIDILLIVFAPSDALDDEVARILDLVQGAVHPLHRIDGLARRREPFGFADGISQPRIEGLPPGARGLRPGEFVLGYPNAFGRFPASPSVPDDLRSAGLAMDPASGRRDLGRNGTFLVLRQLEQNVEAFRAFVERSGNSDRLGAQMVGRWKSGASLLHHPDRDPAADQDPAADGLVLDDNDFGYRRDDPHGFRCPIGAHIRRANPRDSFAQSVGRASDESQTLVDEHRILRRGRVYEKDGKTGLMFLCLNANIERQFEFVQSSWLMNTEFHGLWNESDPLLGNPAADPARALTLQHHRLPQCVTGLGQFVTVRGGGYFFLPGLRAIDYLAR